MVVLCIAIISGTVFAQYPIWPQPKVFVGEMYNRILDRNGNKLEILNKVVPLLKCQITRESVIVSMFSSGEYAARNRSNRQFMNDVYFSILRRNPTPGETYNWIEALSSGGLTRMQTVNLFLNSNEYLENIEQHEDDCMFAEDVAFYYIFPGGGYTIQEYCERLLLDLPELNRFELIVKVKGLVHNHSFPFKGQIFFLSDAMSYNEDWDNSALVRKYGYYPGIEHLANMVKWSYTLSDHFEWEEFIGPLGWNPNTIYEFKIIVNGDLNYGIQLWRNGELLRASAQTVPWTPVEQEIWIGSPSCEWDGGAGYGSIPGACYISVKMIDLD